MSYGGDVSELQQRLQRQLESAVKDAFSEIQDHVNFTLQRAYFKCAYQCFDRTRDQQEISRCVERCGKPVFKANSLFENEMSKFQERLTRNLMVCQDKFEAKKLARQTEGSIKEVEQCMKNVVNDHIQTLPLLAAQLKSQMPSEPNQGL